MALGRPYWKEARARIAELLSADVATLRDNAELQAKVLVSRCSVPFEHQLIWLKVNQSDVEMRLPAFIQDYTDFYSSREHATNVGTMFRGADNALMPNWYPYFQNRSFVALVFSSLFEYQATSACWLSR